MAGRIFLLATLLLIAPIAGAESTTPAAVLYFLEHEQGAEPYRTRMIVTAGYVRMDDGLNSHDYLLFSRADSTIYSISHMDRQILEMRPRKMEIRPPAKFTHQVFIDNATFPPISGHKVVHYELLTNNQRCYDLYAADGLLPDVVEALRQFRIALAGQQALTVPVTPTEIQSPCDLANNVFLPARQLEHGFPVRLVDADGKTSELVDYQTDFRATASLFRLPASYRRLTLEELKKE